MKNYEVTIENQGIKFSTIVTAKGEKLAEKQAIEKIEYITNFDPTWSGDWLIEVKS